MNQLCCKGLMQGNLCWYCGYTRKMAACSSPLTPLSPHPSNPSSPAPSTRQNTPAPSPPALVTAPGSPFDAPSREEPAVRSPTIEDIHAALDKVEGDLEVFRAKILKPGDQLRVQSPPALNNPVTEGNNVVIKVEEDNIDPDLMGGLDYIEVNNLFRELEEEVEKEELEAVQHHEMAGHSYGDNALVLWDATQDNAVQLQSPSQSSLPRLFRHDSVIEDVKNRLAFIAHQPPATTAENAWSNQAEGFHNLVIYLLQYTEELKQAVDVLQNMI